MDYFVKLKAFGAALQSQQLVKSTRPKPEEEVIKVKKINRCTFKSNKTEINEKRSETENKKVPHKYFIQVPKLFCSFFSALAFESR